MSEFILFIFMSFFSLLLLAIMFDIIFFNEKLIKPILTKILGNKYV